MADQLQTFCLAIVLAPLTGAAIAGFAGHWIGPAGAHRVTILGVGISSILSLLVYKLIVIDGEPALNTTIYTWAKFGEISFTIGFLVDELTATMMVVVTFVSWMIHFYTIGYMHDDPGYQRFFSYISLFTFAMLMLVMANNFLQLFFGWEAVGLVSYLLIGFWHHRATAVAANLKAFLVNRVGDLGFLLGIAAIWSYFYSLDYLTVFSSVTEYTEATINIIGDTEWSVLTVICLCLFVGAMGKSAQVPLHVWLPDSMEGPTPISALIHAATMVTAGIFMVARMSPLFEWSAVALNFMLFTGAITALFMGFLGLVQHDIKRVVAYSTLSQLGYMTVALGASAYSAAIFHLVTHAFFKALLFLAAGSVIIGVHHEQDMRKMGGLFKKMPLTWITCFIATLALIGFPGTAGFFSKDAIIQAVQLSQQPLAPFAWFAVLIGVFITALYSFRLFFLSFHGVNRMGSKEWQGISESGKVILLPLIILAIPSVFLGWLLIEPMLFGEYFGSSALFVRPENDVLAKMATSSDSAWQFLLHAFSHPAVLLLMAAGVFVAWLCYIRLPQLPSQVAAQLPLLYRIMVNKYGFDAFNQRFFAEGGQVLGRWLWKFFDVQCIDETIAHRSSRLVQNTATRLRFMQSGRLYQYAFLMIIGLLLLLTFF